MRVMKTENKVQKEVAEMPAGGKISGGSSDTKTRNMGWIDRDQASQKSNRLDPTLQCGVGHVAAGLQGNSTASAAFVGSGVDFTRTVWGVISRPLHLDVTCMTRLELPTWVKILPFACPDYATPRVSGGNGTTSCLIYRIP